ncbi:MAG: hypothetical protein AAFX54_09275 [Pseudomonadota bacterium]
MTAKTIRHIIIGLLMFTGVFHLAVALLGSAPGLGLPLAAFGVIFTVISFYVRRDTNDGSKTHSRNAIIAAIAACSAGLGLGGFHYLSNGGPVALPIMFLIDVAVIVAGVFWFMKVRAKA